MHSMTEVFKTTDQVVEIGDLWIGRLKAAASASPLRRSRVCLHLASTDNIQEMILALCSDVLFKPHRHLNKTESFHIIEGELDVVVFTESGETLRVVQMGPIGSGKTFCYRLNASLYHALLPRTPFVVFHETTEGPFLIDSAQYAPWAPEERAELRAFLEESISRRGRVHRIRA
jgi:cupin fold WbuC family metalloprotein